MAVQEWSDEITVVELGDDPQFTDELTAVMESSEKRPVNLVLNFAAVSFVNSSNIACLLRLRKMMISQKRRLVFCGVNEQVSGVFDVTGLDRIFKFTDDISTALATIQLA